MDTDVLKETIDRLKEPHQLELFGKTLSSHDFLSLLGMIEKKSILINGKLNSVLAGLTNEVFSESILKLSVADLALLQHESATIPVQHHLTVLSQEKLKVIETMETLIISLEMIIDHLEVEQLGMDELPELLSKIDELSVFATNEVQLLSKALALAWNSNRIDLIDTLSQIKERLQKYKSFSIESSVTGLIPKLYARLNKIYEDKSLNDETLPAIESLAKLSLWHVQDYFDIGLLPTITSKELLDLDETTHTEQARADYRASLIEKAKQNLENVGLISLADLKRAGIYSKKALQEYLSRNRVL